MPERLAVSVATLNLLANTAENGPLLCVVDDAHWVDHASVETLAFAARRLRAEAIVMLFASRDPRPGFAARELPELRLHGLAPAAARTLLADRVPDLAERAAAQLVRLTRGNPLALLELPRSLGTTELATRTLLDEPLRVSAEIEHAFLERARVLSADARRALVFVAAAGSDDHDTLWRALDAAALTRQSVDEARDAGLLSTERLEFCHPLARSALYQLTRPSERRIAHAALAGATTEPDRRAWHHAAAADGRDERIAAALESAADSARRRGGVAAEAKALVRAAELTPDSEVRAARMMKGALAAEAAGWAETAEAILADVARSTTDGELRAKAVSRRSYLLADRGEFERARALGFDEAEAASPVEAAHILSGGAFMAVSHSLDIPAALALSERAWRLAGAAAPDDLDLCEMVSRIHVLAGRAEETTSLLRACIGRVDDASVHAIDFATDLLYLEDYPRALELLERVVGRARAADASGLLSYALDQLAKLETRLGNLTRAYALELEALELGESLVARAASLAWLSLLGGSLGRAESRAHAEEALAIAQSLHDEFNVVRARAALGAGALARSDASVAVTWLEPAVQKVVDGGVELPNFFRLDGDLIEALTRCDRADDAELHLARLDAQAHATGSAWALATAARCRAFLSPDSEVHDTFEAALELHQREPSRFERARTELCYGERLRRGRKRRAARDQLYSALESFERIEASPWIDRTRIELRATGEHLPRRDATPVEQLTPQEFQVAKLVAEGLTNREVAARLFLSTKTVEFHLSRAFRKLGTRSRGELIRLFATQEPEQRVRMTAHSTDR